MSLNPFFTQAKIQIMDFFSFSITSQKVTGSEGKSRKSLLSMAL
jgi:hypothetical protein